MDTRALSRLGNAVVPAILRLPAHRLLSSSVMLLMLVRDYEAGELLMDSG